MHNFAPSFGAWAAENGLWGAPRIHGELLKGTISALSRAELTEDQLCDQASTCGIALNVAAAQQRAAGAARFVKFSAQVDF